MEDREYAYRTLQVQYTFSIREYTHTEKVSDSSTHMKQFMCYRQNKQLMLFVFLRAMEESDPRQSVWSALYYHYTNRP